MLKRIRELKKSGQSIVELALVLPFFLMVVLGGIVDFGFAFYNYLTLQRIVGDTAKYMAMAKTDNLSEVEQYAMQKKPAWWDSSFQITVSSPEEMTNQGPEYKVPVGYALPPNAKSYLYKVEGTYESALYTPFYQTLADKLAGKRSMTLNAEAAFKNALHTRRQPLRKITIPQTGGGWMGPGGPPWAGGPGGHP